MTPRRRTASALLLALAVASGVAAAENGAAGRASATLELRAAFAARYVRVQCAPNAPPGAQCRQYVGAASVAGLGRSTEAYVKVLDGTCPPDNPVEEPRSAVIEVAAKGAIQLSLPGPICAPSGSGHVGPLDATISGGSGRFAGASGNLVFESDVSLIGTTRDDWTGSLTVPGYDFDLTPPVLRGTHSRTMRVRKNAKRARVVYVVTAHDAVDGAVKVACKPRSGSRFTVGRTVVRCVATDSSANTTTKRFAITVKKSRR